MTKIILLFIISLGLQLVSANLDDVLQSFLASMSKTSFVRAKANDVKNLYNLYKTEFDRNPMIESEENLRFVSFNNTLNAIIDHCRQNNKTYTLGLNHFADWTQDELSKLRSGIQIPKDSITQTNVKPGDRLLTSNGKPLQKRAVIPTSYDLTQMTAAGTTNVPVVTSIKDQGQCGSCYAFAFISLLEYQYAVQLKRSASLSEQQAVDCSTYDNGCNGGYFTNTFNYLKNNLWQEDYEVSYPYKGTAGRCAFTRTSSGVRFGSLSGYYISSNNAAAMQQALVSYGPLWVSLFVGDQTTTTYKTINNHFNSYRSGVFQASGCPTSASSSNHAVVIVGYGVDATTKLPYWKVRNSWGIGWGENGYFRIQRGVNMCGIEAGPFFMT